MQLFQRFLIAVLLLGLGCAAQANTPEVNQRVERQIRLYLGDRISPAVNISVGARTPSSDFPNYDKVVVTLTNGPRKQDLDFLIAKDNSRLVRVTEFDLTKDPYAEVMKKIDIAGRPIRGDKDAKVTVVNFDDFECPFCSRMHAQLAQEILKLYGPSVRIIYKDFPLSEIHPWAIHAAVDANCLAAQNTEAYWDFADYIHAHQKDISGSDMKPPYSTQFAALDKTTTEVAQRHNLQLTPLLSCMKSPAGPEAVNKSFAEGLKLGLAATPTLFINGAKIEGAAPMSELQASINRALQDAGQPVPPAAMLPTEPPKPAAAAKPAEPPSAPAAKPAPEAKPATSPH